MEEKQLRETLGNLHTEIENTPSVSDESREVLLEVMKDIVELLERSEGQTSVKSSSLSERLKEMMTHLEVDHPRMAKAIERVVEALSAAGI